jgi:TolA-binding protein
MKFKLLAQLFLFGASIVNAESIEEQIKANETVIDSLQKVLDGMQSNGETSEKISSLQKHIDEVIARQNKLLEEKSSGKTDLSSENAWEDAVVQKEDLDAKIRRIVKEELARNHMSGMQHHASKAIAPGANPYDTNDNHRAPTEAELSATAKAEAGAPALPEAVSPATAQYQQALGLYNKGSYKEAGASFGRIVKTYPKDPIVTKALVHLAFSLEKQGDLESAVIVAESALAKKLDDIHKVDCHLISLQQAKSKGNEKDIEDIKKILKASVLSAEQKAKFEEITAKSEAKKPAANKEKPKKSAANG